MKVTGPNGLSQAGPAKGARPAAASGFSLGGASGTGAATQAATALGVSGVTSVDALIAMQQVDSATERRRRAVRRAGRILDVLDEVKLALLDGQVSTAALTSLSSAVREQIVEAEDPRLRSVLREIETRAAVELAKIEMSRRAA
jgi:hypothetical protein